MENGSTERVERAGLTPVTVLGGFLGAGKTTLLRTLLRQAATAGKAGQPARWAAIVNDVAAINIDGAVIGEENAARARLGVEGVSEVIELGNGCVCCSGAEDLGEAIARLASSGRYEHLWVETSGVADPRGVATLFTRKNPFGRALSDLAQLAALVTVVDVVALSAEMLKAEQLNSSEFAVAGRVGRAVASSGERPLFELMLEQIECADVLVLNHCDRATVAGGEFARIEALVQGLNPRAERVPTERGQVPAEFFTGRVRFDSRETLGAALWVRELNRVALPIQSGPRGAAGELRVRVAPPTARPYHEAKYGLTSCVYRARSAFSEERLRALFAGGLAGVVRAKGFFWTAESPDEMGFVSLAGGVVRWETLSVWWAARIRTGRAQREDLPASVRANWMEPHGDRRQEIVLIGPRLDEARLMAALDSCTRLLDQNA